jgi:hypothetical protein
MARCARLWQWASFTVLPIFFVDFILSIQLVYEIHQSNSYLSCPGWSWQFNQDNTETHWSSGFHWLVFLNSLLAGVVWVTLSGTDNCVGIPVCLMDPLEEDSQGKISLLLCFFGCGANVVWTIVMRPIGTTFLHLLALFCPHRFANLVEPKKGTKQLMDYLIRGLDGIVVNALTVVIAAVLFDCGTESTLGVISAVKSALICVRLLFMYVFYPLVFECFACLQWMTAPDPEEVRRQQGEDLRKAREAIARIATAQRTNYV